jgi:hypothetical protein
MLPRPARLCRPPSRLHSSLVPVCFREFGAEEKDLSRVINPYKNDDERARRAISRCHITTPEKMLAERKEKRRKSCSQPNIPPVHVVVGEYLEDCREKYGRKHKRERIVNEGQDERKVWPPVLS